MFLLILLLISGTLDILPISSASDLTQPQERGKEIYFKGISSSGKPIKAWFGKDYSVEISGELALCSSCHGYDGLGRPEGGVIPLSITWENLTKSYGHIHPDGLTHLTFTEESLKSYMQDGVYPGGKNGNPTMPIYDISGGDLDNLVSYLKKLGTEFDQGLTETEIRIGTIIPGEGSAGEAGEEMQKIIQGYFDGINEKGGIYGRRLELITEKFSDPLNLNKGEIENFIEEKKIFAILSPFTPSFDLGFFSIAEKKGIPIIGPFTLFPVEDLSLNRYIFYILSGLREQAEALVNFASKNVKPTNLNNMGIVYPARKDISVVVKSLTEYANQKGFINIIKIEYQSNEFKADEISKQLQKEKISTLICISAEPESVALMEEVKTFEIAPDIYFLGVLAGEAVFKIPPALKDKIYFAYPTLPEDRKEWGVRELTNILRKTPSDSHLAAQVSAYSAAKILVEVLRRSGRLLNREKFLSLLEGLYNFDTGLLPPISYSKNRHIGAMGAYIVTVNQNNTLETELFSSKSWITLE